jgi:acetylornithine deacetylase/succinyl-diaminopimelate desuccinylase-like protein
MNDSRSKTSSAGSAKQAPELEDMVARAQAAFDHDLFRSLITGMVNIPSPSGEEGEVARFTAEFMGAHGLLGEVQVISGKQANALGRLPSKIKDGPSLLIYGGLDTHIGYEGEERWVAVPYPQILKPEAIWDGDEISGLSAENPKGYAACAVMAGICLAKASLELRGDITVGLGAGGMPTLSRPGWANHYVGHGVGALFMLQRGVRPDYCIFCKPRYTVSWEEVGICLFRIIVKGGIAYTGTRHAVASYPNPIPKAAHVITALENWFKVYTKRHTGGALVPQGGISSVNGGCDYNPIASTGRVEILVDLRPTPRVTPAQVQRELQECLNEISAKHPEIETELEMVLAMPGATTPKENWIVQSMIRAWEETEKKPHQDLQNFSGYTDASAIRQWGIPTARLGVPARNRPPDPLDTMPMNRFHVDDAQRLVNVIVRSAIDTCTRSYPETCRSS